MKYRKRNEKQFLSGCVIMILLFGIIIGGCSSQNSIVGTWYSEKNDYTRTFYEDGTCRDSDDHSEIMNYKQQEDGTLMLTWGLGNQRIINRTDDKELALEDENYEYYYLSGNTLVIYGNEYERK